MVMIPMVSMAMVSIVIRHVCQVMTSLAVGILSDTKVQGPAHCVCKESELPNMVMLGFSFPSLLNRDSVETRASGSFGLGSLGEPSTRDHAPRIQSQPMMLCRIQLCSYGEWKEERKKGRRRGREEGRAEGKE